LISDQLAHQVAGSRAFLAENRLLVSIEFFPGHGAYGMDHVVVDMPGNRKIFLHLIKLVEIDNRDRIFLAVDDFLRQRKIEFRKSDSLHCCTERFQGCLDLQLRWSAQLETSDVTRAVDRTHGVGDVAETVFPIAQQDETLLLGERRQPSHSRTIEYAE